MGVYLYVHLLLRLVNSVYVVQAKVTGGRGEKEGEKGGGGVNTGVARMGVSLGV